jgi:hypothetical protein
MHKGAKKIPATEILFPKNPPKSERFAEQASVA